MKTFATHRTTDKRTNERTVKKWQKTWEKMNWSIVGMIMSPNERSRGGRLESSLYFMVQWQDICHPKNHRPSGVFFSFISYFNRKSQKRNSFLLFIFYLCLFFYYFYDRLKLGLWIMEEGGLGGWRLCRVEKKEKGEEGNRRGFSDLHSLEGRRIISNVV